jgi:hypothetical protein
MTDILSKENPFLTIDFSAAERRVLGALSPTGDVVVDAALKLGRKHPLRFALLYGMGPGKLYDCVKAQALPSVTERRIDLECEIRCFENWAYNTNEAAQRRAAAGYEAVTGLPFHPAPESPTVVNDDAGTVTGRWCSQQGGLL